MRQHAEHPIVSGVIGAGIASTRSLDLYFYFQPRQAVPGCTYHELAEGFVDERHFAVFESIRQNHRVYCRVTADGVELPSLICILGSHKNANSEQELLTWCKANSVRLASGAILQPVSRSEVCVRVFWNYVTAHPENYDWKTVGRLFVRARTMHHDEIPPLGSGHN
jgi:hypothetical protein